MNTQPPGRGWRFGPFLLDSRAGELRCAGEIVKLQEKPLRLLEVLVSHPGEVVTREALWQALWPDAHVDFDNGLHNAVSRLRSALGEHAALVETVGRRGYRLAGEVVAVATGRPPSLVVLPLQWLGPPSEPWFADGLTEALIAELARRPGLHVISWTTAQRYRGDRPPLAELSRRLGVDLALEGSVARHGGRMRVAVRLLDAEADAAIWSATYESEVEDALALQVHVARCVTAEMPPVAGLPGPAAAPRKVDAAVLDAYFKGRHHWNHRTEAGLRRGIEMFERALALDPDFALAQAGIADCYNSLSTVVLGSPPGQLRPLAMAAARRAIAADPQLAEGHASLGYACLHDCAWREAEDALARALVLRPGYAEAHAWSAHLHCALGRHEEAVASARRAAALEPLSIYVRATLGFVLYVAGRLGEARRECESALEVADAPIPRLFLGFVLMAEGRGPEAVQAVERAVALTGRSASILGWLAGALAVAGLREQAVDVRRELLARAANGYVPAAALAFAAFAVGDDGEGYVRLREAVAQRADVVAYLGVIPYFDRERSDPRYRELLRLVALA